MKISAYDTEICRNYNTATIVESILRSKNINANQYGEAKLPSGEDLRDCNVTVITPGLAKVPLFTHPIIVKDPSWGGDRIFVDVRNFTRESRDGSVTIHANMDYNLAVLRGIMQDVWNQQGGPSDIMSLGTAPVMLYTLWIGNMLNIKLGLTPDVQVRVNIIVAYFYLCMFKKLDRDELDEDTIQKFSVIVARATYAPVNVVMDVIDAVGAMRGVNDLVTALKEHSNSIRFESLNLAFLYTAVIGSWYGSNSKEILSVAIEHPPTWVAICYTALKERGYKNTGIGRLAVSYDRNEDVVQFQKAVSYLAKVK